MRHILASLAILMMLGAPPVVAQSWDHNDARSARQNGDIIPLRSIIQRLKRQQGGRYLDAKLLSRAGGGSEYHIDWEKDGRKFVIVVDAQSGRILRSSRG